jgi:hypothetical protein
MQSFSMQCPRISNAKAVDNHRLIIEFSNAEVKEYTIHHLLENSVFAPLKQPAFLRILRLSQVDTRLFGIKILILASMNYGKTALF